jgi:hypothetical protein
MGKLTVGDRGLRYQWASDVDFDGVRLEVLTDQGNVLFDISVPEQGPITVNTFSNEVPIDVITAAVSVAGQRR